MLPATYKSGFAPRDGVPRYPSLWKGCVGAWAPSLGPTGLTLRDWSGYGNHGTLTSMDPGTDWVASDGKMALDFDGSDDYVDIFIPQMSSKILGTITGWIKGTAGQGQYQRIWSLGFPSNTELVTYTNHGVDAIEVRPGNTGVTLNSGVTANGVWNHITVVMYSATFVEIYVNGNLADSNAATTVGGFDVSGQIRIGEIAFGSSGYCMAMQCDDIRIYNRAITPSEIALLAQRRGIAYETRRVPVVKGAAAGSGFKSAWSVGSNIVIGV